MTTTPYTDSIRTQLDIDIDGLGPVFQTHGTDSPIGECAKVIMTTVWEMESAERAATQAISSLTDHTKQQAANLAGNGKTFDPSWLATYANRANEANATLTAGVERLRAFKRLLDGLLKQVADRAAK